jgi:hypothetical protein
LDVDAFFGNTGCVTKNVFFIGLILAASGLVSPPIALAGGLIYGFSFVHPFHLEAKQLSKLLLQASVVGLGFGMDLQQVMQAGRSGFIYTAGSISIALLLGWGLGRLLRVRQSHMWRERHCGDCPNHQCEPGGNCRLARNSFCSELYRLAHLPSNRDRAAYVSVGVWSLVGTRHS